MPIARFQTPDGRIARFEVAEGTTPEQAMSMMQGYDFGSPKQEFAQGIGRTALEQGLQGATFGLADEVTDRLGAAGATAYSKVNRALGGNAPEITYDQALKDARGMSKDRMQQQFEQNPATSVAANIGGALLTGGAGATTKAGTALANSLRSGNVAARIGKGATAGGYSGAAFGLGSADDGNRAEGLARGAVFGGLTGGALPAVGAAVGALKGGATNIGRGIKARSVEEVQNTADDMLKAGGKLYEEMRSAGATFNRNKVASIVGDIDTALSQKKFIAGLNPKTLAIVEDIKQSAQKGTLDLDELDQYRRMLGRIGNTEDGVSAGAVRRAIDDSIERVTEKDLAIGNIAQTKKALDSSIDEWGNLKDLENNIRNSINNKFEGLPNTWVEKFNAGRAGKLARKTAINESAQEGVSLSNVRNQIRNQEDNILRLEREIDEIPQQYQRNKQGIEYLKRGRAQYAQASKFEAISDILRRADGDPNKIKSALKRFSDNESNLRGWTQEEKDALKNAYQYTTGEGLTKMLGKFGFDIGGPISAGNAALPVIGGVLGSPVLTAAGTAARQGQKYLARGKAETLLQTLEGKAPKAVNGKSVTPILSAPSGGAAGALSVPSSVPMQVPSARVMAQENSEETPQSSYAQKLFQIESSGNPNAKASTSSATGAAQFTDSTWQHMVRKYGRRYGLTKDGRTDPEQAELAANLYAEENRPRLEQTLGRDVNDVELYTAHFLGAGGAGKLLKADPRAVASQILPTAAQSNRNVFFDKSGKPRTVAQTK